MNDQKQDDQDLNDLTPTPPPVSDQIPDKVREAPQPEQDYGRIEVQQYDVPHKRPLASLEETLGEKPPDATAELPDMDGKPIEEKVVNFRPAAMPPVKAVDEGRGVTIATTFTIIVLVAGLAGGFAGYRYFQEETVSADTQKPASADAPKTIETETPTASTTTPTNTATANWTSYENTKNLYTLKFPDTWYSEGTNSPTSSSIQLTSFKPDASASGGLTEGYKVEVIFQDTNGKTLSDWIAANNAAMAAKVSTTEKSTVDTKTASKQTFSAPIHSIGTYLIHNDKVMIITYYAAEKDFTKGITFYEDIINSIKLK